MRFAGILFLLLSPSLLSAQVTDSARFMYPAVVPGIPPVIRAELVARNCLIPRRAADSTISAIHGEFQRPGQVDWAILCITGRRAQILVFLDGDANPHDSMPSQVDHRLTVAKPAYIIQQLQQYSEDTTLVSKGDSLSQAVNHDGIEEADASCCSVVHYWQGRWMEYPGAE